MADMFDCGRSSFESWSRGAAHMVRYLGAFDRTMTAAEAWRRLDCVGKLREEAFYPFERGWNAARAALGQEKSHG